MHDDDLLADLDEYVSGAPDVDDMPEDGALLALVDEQHANRLLRAVRRLERDERRVLDTVNDEIARLRAFAADRCAGIDRRRDWLVRSLEGWARANADGRKTIALPNGTITLRKPRRRVEVLVNGDEALKAIQQVAPSVVRTRLDVEKSAVVADLEVGPPVEGAYCPEPGYVVRAALVVDRDTGESIVVPGVVFYDPDVDDRGNAKVPTFGYKTR